MKTLFILLTLIFWLSPVWAMNPAFLGQLHLTPGAAGGGDPTPPAVCDVCETNLVFSSHFEGAGTSSAPFDVTTGDPCGCSLDASTDITYFGAASNSTTEAIDGTYSFFRAGSTDYATFPITGIAVDEGISVEFNFKYKTGTWTANGTILKISDADSTDYVIIQFGVTDEIKFSMYVNGALDATGTTVDWNLAADTEYFIRIRMRHGSTDPWVEATVDGAGDAVDNDNPGNFNDVPTFGQIGSTSYYSNDFSLDELKIYDVWKTGDEWGDDA